MTKKINSFTSFIGVSVQALMKEGYTPKEAKTLVGAQLMEEYMRLAINEDDSYDYDVLSILLQSVNHVFKIEKQRMQKDAYIPAVLQRGPVLEALSNRLPGHRPGTAPETDGLPRQHGRHGPAPGCAGGCL